MKVPAELYPLLIGFCSVIEGSFPIGGLSFSAAVIIAFVSALCKLNEIHLTEMELIVLVKLAENEYVSVSYSKFDQNCEVLCKKN